MNSSAKTIWLAVLSVVVAAALVLAGVLLGIDPRVEEAVRDFFGLEESGVDLQVDGELKGLQEEILRELQTKFYKEIDPETVAMGAIDGMLESLGDPYTVYYDPEEWEALQEETSGSYSGVGMAVQLSRRLVTVVSVFADSPAYLAGLREGDVVVSVDGVFSTGKTIEEVVSEIKGPEGTKVTLEVYRPSPIATTSTTIPEQTEDGSAPHAAETPEEVTVDLTALPPGAETKRYELTRRAILVPTTDVEMLSSGGKTVAHITLYTFNNVNAAKQLRADVESAIEDDRVYAIILDLRGNGGGLLQEAIDVASIFIDSGVIVTTQGLHYPEEVDTATGDAVDNVPLYVLIDEFTASASEIVAGALQDYGRAIILGETTFGKGLVQSIEELSNKGALKMTTAIYLTPKGRDINATGISPDFVAPDDLATEDVDETVEKALDLISSGTAGR